MIFHLSFMLNIFSKYYKSSYITKLNANKYKNSRTLLIYDEKKIIWIFDFFNLVSKVFWTCRYIYEVLQQLQSWDLYDDCKLAYRYFEHLV